jgi:ATP-dependent DNA helicase DinG
MDLELSDILGPDGLVAQRLKGYEPRQEQIEMADAVAEAFDASEHLLVEAGTGVGKSFAYLIPAVLQASEAHRRVVVSTCTIALQEQLISKDLPFLHEALPVKFTAALGKGRSNYVCFRRMSLAFKGRQRLFATTDLGEQLERLGEWAMDTETGERQEIDFEVSPEVWERVRSDSSLCWGARCEHCASCFFQAARRRMQAADIVVVNHALFFADLALQQAQVQLLGKYDLVVLDEAHTVEGVAGEHFGQSVSAAGVSYLLRDLYNDRTDRGLLALMEAPDAIDAVNRTRAAADGFFEALASYSGPGVESNGRIRTEGIVPNELSPALYDLAASLEALRKGIDEEGQSAEVMSMGLRAREMAGKVEALISQSEEGHVHWMSSRSRRGRSMVTLSSAPVDVSPFIRQLLFDEVGSAVMTSATLATARGGTHGFDYIRRRLGLEEGRERLLASPFDYRRQARLHVETQLGNPNDLASFMPAACEAIEYYVTKTEGRCFVLFTSYRMLEDAADRLEGFCQRESYDLLVQGGRLSHRAMLEQFREHPRSVLLGTTSFWQGVDVAGAALSNVIIAKLPFAVPTDPIIEARMEAIREGGGSPFGEYQLPEAIIRLKQGFGRLIRSSSDTGIVVVLDHRLLTKSYGRQFIQALPDIEVVRDEFTRSARAGGRRGPRR